jgi:metal-responsive CopG/Arc/MetJ family transcriptional regulator
MVKTIVNQKEKAHLVFPQDLLQSIDKLVGKRKRSKFVVEATRKELKRVQFLQALKEAAGTWKDENHPDLKEKGTYQWVREQRQQDRVLKR